MNARMRKKRTAKNRVLKLLERPNNDDNNNVHHRVTSTTTNNNNNKKEYIKWELWNRIEYWYYYYIHKFNRLVNCVCVSFGNVNLNTYNMVRSNISIDPPNAIALKAFARNTIWVCLLPDTRAYCVWAYEHGSRSNWQRNMNKIIRKVRQRRYQHT